jgi:hypothetical protein
MPMAVRVWQFVLALLTAPYADSLNITTTPAHSNCTWTTAAGNFVVEFGYEFSFWYHMNPTAGADVNLTLLGEYNGSWATMQNFGMITGDCAPTNCTWTEFAVLYASNKSDIVAQNFSVLILGDSEAGDGVSDEQMQIMMAVGLMPESVQWGLIQGDACVNIGCQWTELAFTWANNGSDNVSQWFKSTILNGTAAGDEVSAEQESRMIAAGLSVEELVSYSFVYGRCTIPKCTWTTLAQNYAGLQFIKYDEMNKALGLPITDGVLNISYQQYLNGQSGFTIHHLRTEGMVQGNCLDLVRCRWTSEAVAYSALGLPEIQPFKNLMAGAQAGDPVSASQEQALKEQKKWENAQGRWVIGCQTTTTTTMANITTTTTTLGAGAAGDLQAANHCRAILPLAWNLLLWALLAGYASS